MSTEGFLSQLAIRLKEQSALPFQLALILYCSLQARSRTKVFRRPEACVWATLT